METESNNFNPIQETIQLNSRSKSSATVIDALKLKTTKFEYENDLPNKTQFLQIDKSFSGSIRLDVAKKESLNYPKLIKTSQFSDNSIPEQLSAILVERCNETVDDGITELSKFSVKTPDDSFCLMDFVETVFGVCDETEEEKSLDISEGFGHAKIEKRISAEYIEVSHDDNPAIEYNNVGIEKVDTITFRSEKNSVRNQSTKFKTDEKINSGPINQITDQCFDEKKENNYNPIIKSPDRVSLNQIGSIHNKSIAGTTFSIDDFKYGKKANVTAIFLTHFDWDHYHCLKGNLSKPIYLSRITARLLRQLIPLNESMLNVMDVNNTVIVNGVKVTALDANYCPGAIMLLFELSCGFRILYTGDFRASSEMELNPYLTAGKIDLLYLDMKYISRRNNLSLRKVPYQALEKNISDAITVIREFKQSHKDKRILFVFGHHALGNDALWLQIAETFDFKVWTDEFRVKLLSAIGNDEYIQRIVTNAQEADMHLIQHSNINVNGVNEHWKGFNDTYDIVLAIKPNQWVHHKRIASYKGEINIAELEYSGHSNESEIRRFLTFLLPTRVITIVPAGKDRKMYPEVPLSWYKPKWLSPVMKQASMSDFFQAKQTQ